MLIHRFLLIAALFAASTFVVLPPAPAAAQTARAPHPEEQLRSLRRILGAHHYKPSLAILTRIGPDVRTLLVQLIGSKHERLTVRVRATASLALYPTEDVRRVLEGMLWARDFKSGTTGIALRRQAIRSIGWAFGDGAVRTIEPLREDSNSQIREAVAYGLAESGSAAAIPILRAWLPNEPELHVRLAVDKALASLLGRVGR